MEERSQLLCICKSIWSQSYVVKVSSHLFRTVILFYLSLLFQFDFFPLFVPFVRGTQQKKTLISFFPSAIVGCIYSSITSAPGLTEIQLSPR